MRDYTFGRKKAARSTFLNPSLVSPDIPTLANPVRSFGLPTNNVIQTPTKESTHQQAAQETDEQSLLSPTIEQRSFGHDISRIALRRPQAKLTVGELGDKYEQSADWMANQVMRMPDPALPVQLEALSEDDEEAVQRKAIAISSVNDGFLQQKCSESEQAAQASDEQSLLSPAIQQRSFGHDFSRIAVRRPQTKLTVGEPGDKYEQSADLMANQVMRMVVPDQLNADSVQRVQDSLQRKCTACEEEEEKVQTKPSIQMATDGGLQAGDNIESRLSSSKGGGSPLPKEVRGFMEPRFGADFSSVRVHTDSEAVQMNRDLNAQAFTHGSDVYFGAGKSAGNNELTAHELTHVVQQTGGIQAKSNTQTEILQRDCDPTLASCSPDQTTTLATAIPGQTETSASGSTSDESQTDDQAIMQMDKIGKLMAAVKSALIQAPEKFGDQVNALLQPKALLEFAMWMEVFAALQATPAGWGADLAIIGLEAYLIGPSVVQAIDDLVEFFDTAIDAQDKKAIDHAGAALADALGILGIALLMKLLFHGSGEVKPEKAPSGEVEIKPKAEETSETPKENPATDLGTEGGKKVLAEEPTVDGHKVKVTEEGECLICSDCIKIRQEYAQELADPANKELIAEFEAADAIDGKVNPEAKAKAEAEIRQKLEVARAAKDPVKDKDPDAPEVKPPVATTLTELRARLSPEAQKGFDQQTELLNETNLERVAGKQPDGTYNVDDAEQRFKNKAMSDEDFQKKIEERNKVFEKRAEEAVQKINNICDETDGTNRENANVGNGTTEEAITDPNRGEIVTGEPVGATDGHAGKSAQAIKNINENIANIDKARKSVTDQEKIDHMDQATERGKDRISKLRSALDAWNDRASSHPSVWNPDGTSKVRPGFPRNPGPL